ncbi:kinetochore scaffold 1 [Hyperolius riggenbachi]|uniref:kinetochore scaffold 1 n=1 Tax=Hyperolius riggenbachi TaxID=752182 RepID=UPI0035A2E064
MDGRYILQDNDLTERRSSKAPSSILKVPRSPLRSLGSGNEHYQDSTIDKRRKSSRRVSFAETIRVFTPPGAADAGNGGIDTASSSSEANEATNGKIQITGMDTLLHGPIQSPAHQAEWNYLNDPKDRTIFFSSDNDMDMTTSNTVAIDGFEDKSKKIDTSLFLASLKAPNSEEIVTDFPFSTTGVKLQDFQPRTAFPVQTEIKFADFLASLEIKNAKPVKPEEMDKENIFPFAFKESSFSTKTRRPFSEVEENTGNVTHVFREHDDGLDLTKCCTTNIISFLPTANQGLTNLTSASFLTASRNQADFNLSKESNMQYPKAASADQTVCLGKDMDITCSHTTRIHGMLKESALSNNEKSVTCSKENNFTIFTDENEIDDSVFLNSILKADRPCVQAKGGVFWKEQATSLPEENMTRSHSIAIVGMGSPEEDMDMTRSHTVAILGSLDQVKPQASVLSSDKETETCSVKEKKRNEFISTASVPFDDKDLCDQDDMEMTKTHTMAIDGKLPTNANLQNSTFKERRSNFAGLRLSSGFSKTVFFTGDSDDMDLTQSHTVNIDQKFLKKNNLSSVKRKSILKTTTDQTKRLVDDDMETPMADYDLQKGSEVEKTVVFTCQQQDMDLTRSHTIPIDAEAWCREFQLDTCITTNKEYDRVTAGKSHGKTLLEYKEKEGKSGIRQPMKDDRPTPFSKTDLVFPSRALEDKTVVFSSDRDDMDLTRSHTVAIDSKIFPLFGNSQEQCSILEDKNSNQNIQRSSLSRRSVVSEDSDEMELTQSQTVCIDQKSLLHDTSKAYDQAGVLLKDKKTMRILGGGTQNTVFSSDQEDMELTKAHTVAIDDKLLPVSTKLQNPILKARKSNPNSRLSTFSNKTVLFTTAIDEMELTQSHTVCIDQRSLLHDTSKAYDQAGVLLDDKTLGILGGATQNKTVVFSSDQDMELTKAHTVAIDDQLLPVLNNFQNPIVKARKSNPNSRLSTFSNKTVIFTTDIDEMELTQRHTACIEQKSMLQSHFINDTKNRTLNAPDQARHLLADMEMTRAESIRFQKCPARVEDKTVAFTCDQQDMDITRSHTVAIDGDNLLKGFKSDPASNNVIGSNSAAPRCLSGPYPHSLSVPHTVCPDSTMFEDDMEYTKSHTTVIDGEKTRALQNQSRSLKNVVSTDDMDVTKSNTVFIDNLVAGGHSKVLHNVKNISNISFSLCDGEIKKPVQDKAKHVEEIAKRSLAPSNENAFKDYEEVFTYQKIQNHEQTQIMPLAGQPCASAEETNMDITKSNTVFIDGNMRTLFCSNIHDDITKSRDVAFSQALYVVYSGSENLTGEDYRNGKDLTEAKTQMKERDNALFDVLQKDTLTFSCDRDDMDMTKSHTVAIENPILSDKVGKQGVALGMSAKTANTIHKEVEDSERKRGHIVLPDQEKLGPSSKLGFENLSKTEDMEITRSSVSSHMTDAFLFKNLYAAGIPSKSKKKSSGIYDETIHQACNMEETDTHFHAVINGDKFPSKNASDETVRNQGDMEITRCHTAAIESNMNRNLPSIPYMESCAPEPLVNNARSRKSTVAVGEELLKCEKGVFATSMKGSPQRSTDGKPSFQCEQQTMEITKGHTGLLEVNNVEGATGLNVSRNHNLGFTHVGKVELLQVAPQKPEALTELSTMEIVKNGAKNAWSSSLLSKTMMYSEGMGIMELTQVATMPIHGLGEPGKEIPYSGIEKTHLFFENKMDITKSNTVCIDQEFIEGEITAKISHDASVSDPKMGATLAKMDVGDQSLSAGRNGLTYESAQTASDHKLKDTFSSIPYSQVPFQPSNSHLYHEQQAVAGSASSLPSEACAPQNDLEALQDNKVSNKARLSKRVSFSIPEKINSIVREPSTLPRQEKLFSTVLNDIPSSQVECEDMIERNNGSPGKCHFKDHALIGSSSENNQHLRVSVSETSLSDNQVSNGVANAEANEASVTYFQKDKNRRSSIVDITMKIKSLTQKSKSCSSSRTASYEQSTLLQHSYPATGDSVHEPSLFSEELSSKPSTQEKVEGSGESVRDVTMSKQMCLTNKLPLNIFHPKLPNRRQSSKQNMQEQALFTTSKAASQPSRTSVSLKALADGASACIDEEVLPTFPDDHEVNAPFAYEVPEGAWEELSEKETLYKNLIGSSSESKEALSGQKRSRETEENMESHREKKVRLDVKENTQLSVAFKTVDDSSRSDYSSHHGIKTMEQTYYSSSSQESRGDGMSVELSSQQCSQVDSQLPWDTGCGQNLWQKFQDGTILVKEFLTLVRTRILIQKPRYSQLPANLGNREAISSTDLLLDRYIYQAEYQVYDEECRALFQIIEDLKLYTELQEKPLVEVNSLLWEAMRMCTENELLNFGVTLKNLKSIYSKKSKLLGHERKVSLYGKLLSSAQVQVKQIQTSLSEASKLIAEMDDCIASLETETANLDNESWGNRAEVLGVTELQSEREHFISQEKSFAREKLCLEEQKEELITRLGCLQEEARGHEKDLEEPSFTEWDLVEWTDTQATFDFLYESVELAIQFGAQTDSGNFNRQPCRRMSSITVTSLLDEEAAPPSTLLVHRLISQFIEKKGCLSDIYKTQKELPQLLFDLSLVVSRCKLLGEEVEYLMKWGAKYNILQTQIEKNELKLLFSSSAASAKFQLALQISEMYPTLPLSFTVLTRIGTIDHSAVSAVMSKVPVGLWLLKRTVRSIHETLLT